MKRALVSLALVICFFLTVSGAKPQVPEDLAQQTGVLTPQVFRVDADYGKIPLQFIPNRGQVDGPAAFYVQGRDKAIHFAPEGLTFVLAESAAQAGSQAGSPAEIREVVPARRWAVKLDFVDANKNVEPVGLEETGARISFFKGKPEEWKKGLAAHSKIAYRDLWPGIDLVYYGTVDRMKYEFVVHPGADPSRIKLAYRGAEKVSLTEEGRLEVSTPIGGFHDDIPVAWQEIGGEKTYVEMAYELAEAEGPAHVYGFDVGEYDHTQPLVLDPAVLVYCGYIGGGGGQTLGAGIAVDAAGNAYVTGHTFSTEASFPVTVGPDLTHNGDVDAFIAKVNSDGTALVYCGYIGGSGYDRAEGIAVDGSGNAYVTGFTWSTEASFPVTVGPDLTHNGDVDAFIAKVNASGTALDYCGYIGGAHTDAAYGIAVDGSGNAYVTGRADSTETSFPVTVGPDLFHKASSDAFVAKVRADGTALVYCGYIGGFQEDQGRGIAVDGSGNAYVTGYTTSSEASFPVTV
ncbi:MAG: SBBP repeat-containing protein, partial [Candidatus Aminicenantes bacterium]|nr:SBBP repeat-containing protein [Candidatus Aminicenantes bacterium]